jgi:hypothetical protein
VMRRESRKGSRHDALGTRVEASRSEEQHRSQEILLLRSGRSAPHTELAKPVEQPVRRLVCVLKNPVRALEFRRDGSLWNGRDRERGDEAPSVYRPGMDSARAEPLARKAMSPCLTDESVDEK